ncbi:DUF5709 domain-containing protein [Cellulomonas marina]|uniref:DUF5709 domain-containing protein n=1 Tax=Cellulomonas marina TaxID=988821 RepID=A0A1I0XPH0_9CELL|nr:DUF5709 domain-containing protein [Cellulomonas marina]GIG30055.1 hypothetical protein Cma02nite_26550 [Cellulomonas marina]SFB02862.1 hypothetical protein SAMN05421867_105199 [Cellulomonas marina]
MTENTPATSTDAALGSEGDSDQLPGEDTMIGRGVDDLLDEGYTPPERPRTATQRYGETEWEEQHRETIDQRIVQEEPEVWDQDEPPSPEREPLRAGRLSEDDDAVEAGGTDMFAVDQGVDGGAASAEEAAVHLVAEETDDEYVRDNAAELDELDAELEEAGQEPDEQLEAPDPDIEEAGLTSGLPTVDGSTTEAGPRA